MTTFAFWRKWIIDGEIYLGCYDNEIYFGLRRRNNELHELTNFVAALGRIMTKCAASALKGQPVLSPGQRPGYQGIKPYAL